MPLLLRSLALLLVLLAAWPQAPAHATQATPAPGADQVVLATLCNSSASEQTGN